MPPGLDIHIQSCGDLKNLLDCFIKQFRLPNLTVAVACAQPISRS